MAPIETLLTPELPITRKLARQAAARVTRRRRRPRRMLAWVGGLFVAAGVGIAIFATVDAPAAERVYGDLRIAANDVAVQLSPATATGEKLPTIQLGQLGPESLMDTECAAHKFPQLEQYAADQKLQPMYAAHNGCGGDVILPLELGEHVAVVAVDGETTKYAVTDSREVPKYGSTTGDARGMGGSIVLQTCHYGEPVMKLVALTPVA